MWILHLQADGKAEGWDSGVCIAFYLLLGIRTHLPLPFQFRTAGEGGQGRWSGKVVTGLCVLGCLYT